MAKASQNKKTESSGRRKSAPGRLFLLSFIPFLVFSLGFIPVIVSVRLILYVVSFTTLLDYILLPFIIALELFILLISQILISGAIIRIFNIKYREGTYPYTTAENMAFKWMLLCQLYTPMRKILDTIPMGYVKAFYLRLLGMKIGRNNLIGGTIKDPCVTEFGNNITMGEYAILYGHIHNYEKGTITMKKVKIGNNCIIGAGAIIMPGVVMEDNAVLGAGALATKNHVLEKNKTYGGNPARKILVQKKKQT